MLLSGTNLLCRSGHQQQASKHPYTSTTPTTFCRCSRRNVCISLVVPNGSKQQQAVSLSLPPTFCRCSRREVCISLVVPNGSKQQQAVNLSLPPTFCRCSRREVWVSLMEKNMGPSSASHSGSTAVTHCGGGSNRR